jgi:hypothetical protein
LYNLVILLLDKIIVTINREKGRERGERSRVDNITA